MTDKPLSEHPCYGLGLNPTQFSHRNSWPLSPIEQPYCVRCGTEIEGPNNTQKPGSPLLWERRATPKPEPTPKPCPPHHWSHSPTVGCYTCLKCRTAVYEHLDHGRYAGIEAEVAATVAAIAANPEPTPDPDLVLAREAADAEVPNSALPEWTTAYSAALRALKACEAHFVAGSMGSVPAAAAILRDHVEAKLAEVRADLAAARSELAKADEMWAESQRTIAEQAAVIERLRDIIRRSVGALEQDLEAGKDSGDCDWEGMAFSVLEDARTALQETAHAK